MSRSGSLSPRAAPPAMSAAPRLLPVNRDFDGFQELLSNSFVPMEVSSLAPDSFWSRVRSAAVDQVQVSEITASGHRAVRPQHLITPLAPAYLKLTLQLAGTGLLVQGGREAVLGPGDLAVYDTQKPFSLTFDHDSRSLVVMFEMDAVDIPAEIVDHFTAVTISGHHGVGNLVVPFLAQLANNLDQLRGPTGPRLAHNMLDLLSTMFSAELGDPQTHRDRNEVLFQRVLDYVDVHLGSSSLTPQLIADRHYVSTRHLHGLFRAHGTTIASWIRSRRLQRCCRDLRDPSLSYRSINAIAARWGFGDAAHFSRLFKAHTGVTPSDFRSDLARQAG